MRVVIRVKASQGPCFVWQEGRDSDQLQALLGQDMFLACLGQLVKGQKENV